jgi:ABC-type lipoprotein release transport system permease subunit
MAGSVFLARTIASQLFGVQPSDPLIFGAVPLLLVFVAVLASYVPAARASRLDPIAALRT